MADQSAVREYVESELSRIGDERLLARIRELMVEPYPVVRGWDYGKPGESYVCWTVLEHRESNTGIAFCDHGFGPSDPWGLVFLSGPHMSIGMDCSWYRSIEDAIRESPAWVEPNPPGYEVE
jgi:hypothetical protein